MPKHPVPCWEKLSPGTTHTCLFQSRRVFCLYSRTSLSRTRLFRITAYLEVKIWSLFEHETMTTGNKIMWKRGEIRSNFSSFSHYFIYIFLTSGVKLHIHLVNVVVQFIVFLTLSTLICRGTDITKCFSESL